MFGSLEIFLTSVHIHIEVDLPVCNIRLNQPEHLLGGFGDLDENTVVDLKETEKL